MLFLCQETTAKMQSCSVHTWACTSLLELLSMIIKVSKARCPVHQNWRSVWRSPRRKFKTVSECGASFQKQFSFLESSQTLAGIAVRDPGKSGRRLSRLSTIFGELFPKDFKMFRQPQPSRVFSLFQINLHYRVYLPLATKILRNKFDFKGVFVTAL